MKKWSILLIIAIVALLMPMSTAMVNAQEEASLSISKAADKDSATIGETVTYTYTITNNSDNVTLNNITLVDSNPALGNQGQISLSQTTLGPNESVTANATYTVEEKDLPGPIENTATISGTAPDSNPVTATDKATVELTYNAGLQVTKVADRETASFKETIKYTYTITNTGNVALSKITLADDKIPEVSLSSDNTTLAAGQSITAKGTYSISITDFFRKKAIINKADVTAVDPQGKLVTASATATVSVNKSLFWKRDILKHSGVPGKGIDKAPGLQKPFNPKSQAAEHAGKKDKPKTPKQLQLRESTENQSSEDHLRIRSEMQNQAGGIHVVEDDDEDSDENAQLEENSVTDNQTQGPEATQGNGHKPDKDKPKKNPNSGNNH